LYAVTGVQTCALPIWDSDPGRTTRGKPADHPEPPPPPHADMRPVRRGDAEVYAAVGRTENANEGVRAASAAGSGSGGRGLPVSDGLAEAGEDGRAAGELQEADRPVPAEPRHPKHERQGHDQAPRGAVAHPLPRRRAEVPECLVPELGDAGGQIDVRHAAHYARRSALPRVLARNAVCDAVTPTVRSSTSGA